MKEITKKLYSKNDGDWCERLAEKINLDSSTRMAWVRYWRDGRGCYRCQVLDANPPEPIPNYKPQNVKREIAEFRKKGRE